MVADDRARMLLAADVMEQLSARSTGGRWAVRGLLATRPEVIAHYEDGGTEHVAEARAGTARWISTLSPATAPHLVRWLRTTAGADQLDASVAVAALTFADTVLAAAARWGWRAPHEATGEYAGMHNTIDVAEQGTVLTYRFEDLMLYHGPGSPGGVAHGFKVMQRVLPLLDPDGPVERREISVRTAFGGPGARDAFEMVTRAVTENRYTVDNAMSGRRNDGLTQEHFVFQLGYRGCSVRAVLREGYVSEEFLALVGQADRTAAEEARLTTLKQQMAEHLMASDAADVYQVHDVR